MTPKFEILGCARCGYGPDAHTEENMDRCLFYVDPKVEERQKCARCHHLKDLHDEGHGHCGGVKCKCGAFTLVKPEDAKKGTPWEDKAVDKATESSLQKSISMIKKQEAEKSIVQFSTLKKGKSKEVAGYEYPWNKVPGTLICKNLVCGHTKDKHSLFGAAGMHRCQIPDCPCEDFRIDLRCIPKASQKLPTNLQASGKKAAKPKKKDDLVKANIENRNALIKVLNKQDTADVQQVERTREEGYKAYKGQPGLKLDQPHFSKKKYTFAEIMATELFTYKADPLDKKQNTSICGNCRSSRLDWTSMVLREDEGKEFLRKAQHSKDFPAVYRNIGFFQCNTCHAFLFGADSVAWLQVGTQQPNGSYRYQPDAPAPEPPKKDPPAEEKNAMLEMFKNDAIASRELAKEYKAKLEEAERMIRILNALDRIEKRLAAVEAKILG